MLRMLDLFSGIGGFSYAGEKLVGGYETVAFCEYDKHAQKVLRKHWPDTEIIDDVRELANDADRFRGLVDIVVGGYPCQPFSLAGVRRGDKDDRHLWPEMLRIIQAVRPTWVCGENVAGHISMGLDEVLSDLEAEGYQARCFVIPAVAADAYHRRDRCWVVGYAKRDGSSASEVRGKPQKNGGGSPQGQGVAEQSEGTGRPRDGQKMARGARAEDVGNADSGDSERLIKTADKGGRQQGFTARREDVPNASAHSQRGGLPIGIQPQHANIDGRGDKSGWQAKQLWLPEPAVGRVANGIPGRVHRLKQLGNSIVPQVAARILYAIKEAHNG